MLKRNGITKHARLKYKKEAKLRLFFVFKIPLCFNYVFLKIILLAVLIVQVIVILYLVH